VSLKPPETKSERRSRRRRDASRFDQAKAIPESRASRDGIRAAAEAYARRLDRRRPLTERELADAGRAVLRDLDGDARHLAFAMVMVNNAFWLDQFRAAPFARRMLLLPRCLRNIHGDDEGADPVLGSSDSADIFHIRTRAEQLGYSILVADGTPIVVKVLTETGMDAILGVACLDSLESAFEKVRHVGVPAVAVPLLSANCRDTTVELDQVAALLELQHPTASHATRSYLPLFREAYGLFEEPALSRLLALPPSPSPSQGEGRGEGRAPSDTRRFAPHPTPLPPGEREQPSPSPFHGEGRGEDPSGRGISSRLLGDAADLARGWLLRGGKRLRPFVTLAGYLALAPDGDLPDDLRRVAVAIEAFHKASLVHDDIEDDDATRYDLPTLHRQVGVNAAINVGDYLLGIGYRLVASVGPGFGPARGAALVGQLSDAHLRLAQGQGAELAWRRAGRLGLPLADVLKIYALKTAPAFEAALASGMILAGAFNDRADLVRRFCRYVGVAFQVLNDLRDWESDLRHHRPTVLAVLDLSGNGRPAAPIRRAVAEHRDLTPDEVRLAGDAFEARGVFDTARALVERFRDRALALAADARPEALADLLVFLTEIILRDRSDAPESGCRPATDE